jgi:hypothetical protein
VLKVIFHFIFELYSIKSYIAITAILGQKILLSQILCHLTQELRKEECSQEKCNRVIMLNSGERPSSDVPYYVAYINLSSIYQLEMMLTLRK